MKVRSASGEVLLLVLAAGLLGAIVHLVVVLATPALGANDAYARLARVGRIDETVVLAQAGPAERLLPYADPAVAAAYCRFDLSGGPVRVRAPVGRAFASISFHSRKGFAFYALTDRAAAHGVIEAVVATPDDVRALARRDDEESPSRDLRIAAPEREGYVMMRVFSDLPSLYPEAEAEARQLTCAPEPLP